MMNSLGLIIAIVVLVLINAVIAAIHFTGNKTSVHSPALIAMRNITKVYEIMDEIVLNTGASKAAISKVCIKCDQPYAQMLYDNKVEGEERYNQKYTQLDIDDDIINEMLIVAKGSVIAVAVDTLRDNLNKEIYTAEGITYSETYKIIESSDHIYVLVVHYKIPVTDINPKDFNSIKRYNLELRGVFDDGKHDL